MLSERGTAGNWPARSQAKSSSKQGITTLSSMPNGAIGNSVTGTSVAGASVTGTSVAASSEEKLNRELKRTATKKLNLNNATMIKISAESRVQPEIISPINVKPFAGHFLNNFARENQNVSKVKSKSGLKQRIREVSSFNPRRIKQSGLLGKRNSIQEFMPDSSSDAAKWLLFALGIGLLILIGGYGALMAVFALGWGESVSLALAIFLISLIPGLFYLWASHLYDGLDDHSVLYQIGFWGTITILPAIIALPLWIFAAIRDAIEDGDFDEITRIILNAFAWIILILGELISIVTVMYYIYWGF